MDTTVFPISMQQHIVFAGIAFVFFLLQFFRTRRWYQPVMAVAVAVSLLIYVNVQSNPLFYTVGILEGVLLIAALVLSIVQSWRERKRAKQTSAVTPEEASALPEGVENAADNGAPTTEEQAPVEHEENPPEKAEEETADTESSSTDDTKDAPKTENAEDTSETEETGGMTE